MRNIKKISVIFLIILTLFGINLYSSDSGELKVKSAKIQFTRIKIMFNQAINPASINQDSLYLLGEEGKLERNVKLRARSRIMVIKLKKPFSLLKPLILILNPEISSQSGNTLKKGFIKGFNIHIVPRPNRKRKDFFHKAIIISEDPHIEIDPGLFFLAPFHKGRIWGMTQGKPDKDEKREWEELKKQIETFHKKKLEQLKARDKNKKNKSYKRHKKHNLTEEMIRGWFGQWFHPPEIFITGISDGDLVNHDVTCQINVTDPDNDFWFFHAILNFSPYANNTPITSEGDYWLLVVAVDHWYKGDVEFIRFSIDKTPPQFVSLTPSEDVSTRESSITISGEVSGADNLTINNVPVLLQDQIFSRTLSLQAGANIIDIIASDQAGNNAEGTITVTYITDEEPPQLTVTSPSEGTFFNTPTITVSGTVTDESGVIYVHVNTIPADLYGNNFTCNDVPLVEGENPLTLTSEDEWGNKISNTLQVTLDTVKPSISVTQPEGGAYLNTTHAVIKGEVNDASPVTLKINGTGVVLPEKTFETSLALAEGANSIKIEAVDAAGNTIMHELEVFADRIEPMIELTSPSDDTVTNSDKITVSGKIIDENPLKITVNVNSIEGEIIGTHFYFRDISLQEGTNTFEFSAQDRAGNFNQVPYSITIFKDTVIPQLTILSPVTGSLISQKTILVRGTVTDDFLKDVKVNNYSCPIKNNEFNLFLNLVEGSNTIHVTASDTAGNIKTEAVTINVDTFPPLVNINTPQNNALLNTPAITVSGRADDTNLSAVKINGQNALLNNNEFTLSSLMLQEGENQVTVEAEDAAGNTSNQIRTVILDTEVPSIANVIPSDQTTRVPVSSEIRVEFSETINEATLSDQTFYLETYGGGQKINGTITREENQVVFNAVGSLPDSSQITIHVTSDIKDLAGNPIQNPYTGVFFTCDTTSPEPPQVELLPETTSLNKITVTGTAESGVEISISGGFNLVLGLCDDQGNFSIEVTLKQDQLNQLCLYASDSSGNESIPACVFIYHEKSEFVILDASFENNEIKVTFSKHIDTTTLTSDNFIVSSSSGPESGTISFSTISGGTIGIFTPSKNLTSQAIMVDVKTGVIDIEKNALNYPFTKVFNQQGGEVIVQGEVYDDLTGLPLGGALVKLVRVDGFAPLEPAPSAITTKEGKYVIILPSGQSILRISRENYIYSDRVVLTVPGFSSSVFDSRIMPFNSDEQEMVPEGGIIKSFAGGPGGESATPADKGLSKSAPLAAGGIVVYPAGAVDEEKHAQFTVVGPQSLQGRLPSGWSPLAGFDLRIKEESQGGSGLLKPCQLRTTNLWAEVSPSALILAHWDESEYQWKAVSGVSISPEDIIGTIETTGHYAFLIKDTAPAVPPQPVIGEPIAAVAQGAIPAGSEITALLNFDPSTIYPGETSFAVLNITSSAAISSGVPVQAKVNESYELLTQQGSNVFFAPYRADLTAYNYGTSALKIEFSLSPNLFISLSELKIGTIKADMVRYGAGVSGVVVGPNGGTVSGDGGAEIIIEQGSVNNPIAVTIKKLEEIELTLQIPSGFESIGAIDLSLGGGSLLKTANLSLSLTQEEMDNIPADAQLFIVRLEKLDYQFSWVLKSQGIVENSRIKSFIDTSNSLPFAGITEGGTYLFLRALSPVGFLFGTVLEESQPLHNAIVSADNHEIKSVSAENYVQIGFFGSVELTALNQATRDQGKGSASLQSVGEIFPLDITIEKTGPEIVAITPINDETDVPLNSKITFIFSKPIRASTFNSQTVVIRKGGEKVEGVLKLSSDGKQGEFIPNEDFSSDSFINITVFTGLQDFHSNGMSQEFTSRFHTVDIIPPEADLSKIKVLIPDENGNVKVTGGPGSVEPGTQVFVYNERTGMAVGTDGNPEGSFTANIGAEISDKLKITIIDPAGNETVFTNKPFVSADGRRMVVDSSGGEFITPEGLGIKIEEGTFAGPVNVGIYEETDPAILAPVPEGFEGLKAIRVDLSGYSPAKAFKLSILLPAGVPGDAEVFFAREVTVFGEKKLMVVDTTSIENNRIETNSPPFLGCTAAGVYRVIWNRFHQVGFGTGRVMRPDVVVTAGEFVYVCGGFTLDFIMPVYIGKDVTLTVKDIDTGEILYEKTSPALTMTGQVYSFGGLGDEKDMEPPYLIRSVGIKSLSFDVTNRGITSGGITVTPVAPFGNVESIDIKGDANITMSDGKVIIHRLSGQVASAPKEVSAIENGSFEELAFEAKTGDRIFMTIEEDNISIDQEFILSFSEPIKDPNGGEQNSIMLYEIDEEEKKEVDVYTELLDTNTDLLIRPKNQLRDGTRYKFEIKDLLDQSTNKDNKLSFDSYFRTFRSERIGSFSNLNSVYGSVRYGSYLYVASGDGGIDVLDVSNPTDIQSVGKYQGTGTQFRAVALYDGPGKMKKLIVVGGGYRFNGYLSILDLSNPKNPQEEKFMYISRTSASSRDLPEGKPRNIAVIGNYAFVPIFGSGLQVIDLLKLLNGSAQDDCRIGFYLAQGAEEVRAYRQPATEYEPEKVIAVLLEDRYGVHIIDFTNALMPIQISRYLFGSTIRSGSLELALDYPIDLNEDGKYEDNEKKDLLFFSMIPYSYVFVVDITNVVEKQPVDLSNNLIKKIKIDEQSADYIFNIDINAADKTLAVTDSNNGLLLLDMRISLPDYPYGDPEEIVDDTLDRVMAKINIGGSTSRQGLIWDKDLNVAYIGKSYGKVEAVKLGNPRIKLVYDVVFDPSTHKLLNYKEVIKIAPSGIKAIDNTDNYPDEIYVMAFLPGGVSKKTVEDPEGNITYPNDGKAVCELWSLNSSNVPIIPWGNGKVKTYIKNLELFRLSNITFYDEYNIFLSKPIRVTLDPDETREIEYTDQYGAKKSDIRLLSGDIIWTHISGLFITEYELENYISVNDSSDIGDRKFSVRADLIDRKENFDFEGVPVDAVEKPNSPTNNPSIFSGVLLHTGEFVFDDIDLHIPGRGFDFVFKRTYRSQSIYSGLLGWGWDHNYNKRLLELPSGDMIYFDGTGRRERYTVSGQAGTYESPVGRFTELKRMYDGTFRHIFSNRTIEFFDSFGRLIKIQDRNQNKMEFYYNLSGQLSAVMDTMGRMIEFEYNPSIDETTGEIKPDSGRLINIRDFSERDVNYEYKDTGDLWKVDFEGRVKKYRYSANDNEIRLAHNLEKVIDPRGAASDSPVLTVTYDGEDKIERQRFADMDRDIVFSIGETSTTVTDARGNPKIFNFTADTRLEVTNGGHTFKYEFNDDRLVTKIEFPEGNSVTYDYYPAAEEKRRSAGNLESVVSTGSDGLITTTYKYETYWNQVEKIIDPKENETTISHDSNGNIKTVTLPETPPYIYTYYDPGEPRICGVLKSITDPEGNVTEYTYYQESSPSGDGTQPVFGRNPNSTIGGYLQFIVIDKDGDRISQNFQYDQLGNITKKTDGEGVETHYLYDNPFGELSTLIKGASQSEEGQPQINLLTTFDYDKNGNITGQTSRGITTEYEYDRLNRLRIKRYKGGSGEGEIVQEYEYKYNNNSNLKEIIYPKGNKDTFEYNNRDLLSIKMEGTGLTTTSYDYNPNGQLNILTDGENNTFTHNYDGHGRLKEILDQSGNKITYGYDANSNVTSIDGVGKNGASLNQQFEHDSLNRLTHQKIQKESGFITTQYGYNAAGSLNSITTPNLQPWEITPTGSGLTKTVTDPTGNIDTHTYDKRGWLKTITETEPGQDGKELTNNVTNDVLGNPVLTGDSIGRDYKYIYNQQKQVLDLIRDPGNGVIIYEYDGLNRLHKVIRHISYEGGEKQSEIRYEYDDNGNLEKIFDEDGNETRYVYDTKERLKNIIYPGTTGAFQFYYNKNDQIKMYTDLNLTTVTNTYDAAGRLTHRIINRGEDVEGAAYESFEYNGLGRLTKAANNFSEVLFIYDKAGRLDREIQQLKGMVGEVEIILTTNEVQYGYDDNGNVTRLTYPSGKILTITPDQLDRISTIAATGKSIASYTYEGKGKVLQKTLQNAITMDAAFDIGRRPLSLTYKNNENKIFFNKNMDWNLVDLKNSETEEGKGEKYKYDTAYRLRKVTDAEDNSKSEYDIDGVENIDVMKRTKKGITEETGNVYNERHQLVKYNGIDLTYDKNGNLREYENEYIYDWKNQLVKVITGTGVNVDYNYDALGRRIEKIVTDPVSEERTRYIYDGYRVIEEHDKDEKVGTRYTYGNGIDEPVEIEKDEDKDGILESYIPMQNTIGSVIGIAGNTGKLLEKVHYDDYGNPTFIYDEESPKVNNVRIESGKMFIRFSEPVDEDSAENAIKIKKGADELSGSFDFDEENRRIIFTPSTPLSQNEVLTVKVTIDLEDTFGNKLENEFSQDFTYTGFDLIVYDRVPPEVEVVKLKSGEFIIEFDEEIDSSSITDSIDLTSAQGNFTGSITQEDTKTLKFVPENSLSNSVEYTINVKTILTDLSGKNLSSLFREKFINTGKDILIYERPDPNEHKESIISNNVLFQGRNYDSEIGLYYYRARYFHPGINRFLQTDPMGYEDSLNLYQAFNQNPVNFVDPFGEYSREQLYELVRIKKEKGIEAAKAWIDKGSFSNCEKLDLHMKLIWGFKDWEKEEYSVLKEWIDTTTYDIGKYIGLEGYLKIQAGVRYNRPDLQVKGFTEIGETGVAYGLMGYYIPKGINWLVKKFPWLKKLNKPISKIFKKDEAKVGSLSAEAANAPHISKGNRPPYAPGTRLRDIVLKRERVFVRVHREGNKARSWIMRSHEIEGLTPAQIKDKFALPEIPTFISEVYVPAGARVRVGIVGKQKGWGSGGGTQYELLERLPESAFRNTRRLE